MPLAGPLAVAISLFLVAGARESRATVADGGSIAYPGQFPWHAAVLKGGAGDSFKPDDLIGSGALVSQKFVITATSAILGQFDVDVILGTVLAASGGMRVHVVDKIFRDGYDPATAENDVSLLELETSVEQTDTISAVRLPARYYRGATYVDQTLSVSSWGVADDADKGSFLSVSNVAVVRNRDCQAKQTDPARPLPWVALCVASLGPVPCNGDNGDPIVFLEADGVSTLVGVVSSAQQCSTDKPTLVARVTEILDWIADNSDAVID